MESFPNNWHLYKIKILVLKNSITGIENCVDRFNNKFVEGKF